jgi:hypothetical protein
MGTDIKKSKEFVEKAKPNNKGISIAIDVTKENSNGHSCFRKKSQLQEDYYIIKVYKRGIINTRVDTKANAGVGLGQLLTVKLDGFKEEEV